MPFYFLVGTIMSIKNARARIEKALTERFDSFFAEDLIGEMLHLKLVNEANADRLDQLLLIKEPIPYNADQIASFMTGWADRIPPANSNMEVDKRIARLASKADLRLDGGEISNGWDAAQKCFAERGYTMDQVCAFQKAETEVVAALTHALVDKSIQVFRENEKINEVGGQFNVGLSNYNARCYRKDGQVNVQYVQAALHASGQLLAIRDHFRRQLLEMAKE